MVYRGRPSTGCRKCRERKIKCDENPDGCFKCAERGITCPGYDRTVDAFFHDETANVQAKAKKSKAKAIAAREIRDAQERMLGRQKAQRSPSMHLLSPLVDHGINFFMTHYASGLDQPPVSSHAYHQHISTDGFHPLVATTMTALGVAGLANLYMNTDLKREATRWYLKAIRMANAAISSPEEVCSDTTLIGVNLLSMFEATFNDSSLSGWSSHVDGAAMLVKLRGVEQFSTPAGRRMYLHTIGLLTMNCMGQGIPLPEYVTELNREAEQYMDFDDPRHAFFFLHIKTNDLRAQILNQTTIDLQDVINRALELDEIAISIFEDVDAAWQYDVVPCSGYESVVFGDYYHVYPAHATAQTWNWVRYNRIYFHDVIRNCILGGLATSPPILAGQVYIDLLERSTRLLKQLQSDILATMPQFLHDTPNVAPPKQTKDDFYPWMDAGPPLSTPASTARSSTSSEGSDTHDDSQKTCFSNYKYRNAELSEKFVHHGSIKDRLPIIRISGGYSTLWALYLAGSMPTADLSSRNFVLRCLDRIEREFGIKQAKVLAEALRIKLQMVHDEGALFSICPQYLPPDGGPYVPFHGMDSKVGFQGPEVLMDADFQAGFPSNPLIVPISR